MKELTSACGIDCHACECYKATRDVDIESKNDIAIRWSKSYGTNLTNKDINCDGCMSDGGHFGWCYQCPIRACVVDKGFQSCAECGDFPCATNEFLYNAAPAAKENIEAHRK
jgi:hypothetical protein